MDELNHRRATARLTLLNPDGTPAANRCIEVRQVSHKFLFGCGAFDAVALAQAGDGNRRELLEQRLEKWLVLFNYGTLPFYWGNYEPVEGETAREEMMAAARWLRQRGVRLKGHPLCWHTLCADWLLDYPNDGILCRQLKRIRREATDFASLIDMWDVINEAVIMPVFDRYDNAVTRLCRQLGRVELVKRVFDAARESNPGATLLINDFNVSAEYERLLEELLAAGAAIDAIGIQSHQHQGYWGPDKLNDVLERFSRFGIPIHFTENTLISGELMPGHIVDLNDWQVDSWPSTPAGEDRQAREVTEMYATLFAHPLVEAVTSWDFIDGGWLGAPSGLVRANSTEKPAYFALKELIRGKWETHESLITDGDGCATFTGFLGGYELNLGDRTAEFELERDAERANGNPGIVTEIVL